MENRRHFSHLPDIFSDILLMMFIAPFLFFKWIGDLFIIIIRGCFYVGIKSYNIFSRISAWIKKLFKKQKKGKVQKHKVIFSQRSAWNCLYPSYSGLQPEGVYPERAAKRIRGVYAGTNQSCFSITDYIIKFLNMKIVFPKLPKLKFPKIPYSIRLFFIKVKYFFFGAFVVALFFIIYQIHVLILTLPNPSFLAFREIPVTTKIYDRNGKLLYGIYAQENRVPVELSDIPKQVKQATIAIEDKDFFVHKGLSIRGIIRAIINNLTTNTVQGGSTITQQLIRSTFLTPEKTVERKLKEILLSLWAETIYTKEQLLEMYLNQVPYGGTAWGIEAAAQGYFGKSVKEVDLSEAAFLAGLPAAPSFYSPYGQNPKLAKIRQKEVLALMVADGYITKEQEEEALKKELNFKPPTTAIAAPHFVMYVRDLLEKHYGIKAVEYGGLRVITTLDLDLQEKTEKIVASNIEKLRPLNVGNGAALVTDPKNGEILAMVGSTDYFNKEKEGNVNLTIALRQPGSSIKVVNYSAALSLGFTAASILDDSPITYRVVGQLPYAPVNYDGKYHGKIPLRVALASSYNVPAVKVLSQIGVKQMIDQGKKMGITTWEDESRFGLSLTLGGGEVTMLDMAKVYGALANQGIKQDLTPFIKITDYKGDTIPLPAVKNHAVAVDPGIAFILTSILSDNVARTPAFGPNSALVIPGKTVAVKTGTSDNKRDNWTIGLTSDYVAVVWVGNNDNSPMHPTLASGVTGAAPIWNEIMTNLFTSKEDKPFIQPTNVVTLPCYGRKEYFLIGTVPKMGCPTLATPTNTPIPTKP